VTDPEDARMAELSDRGFVHVSRRHATRFTHLKTLLLPGNSLQLNLLTAFPALQRVSLKCNGIRDIMVSTGDFARLEVSVVWRLFAFVCVCSDLLDRPVVVGCIDELPYDSRASKSWNASGPDDS
jgi:hypothetical protein